jgi:uncharacterized RDD family membrane protein YckC
MKSLDPAQEYIARVLAEMPAHASDRARLTDDVRAHIEDAVERGATPEEALSRLGPPAELARELLSESTPPLASLRRRAAALLFDLGVLWALLVSASATLVLAAGGTDLVSEGWNLALIVGAAVASLVYFPLFEARWGRTPGKLAFGLAVVRADGGRAGWKHALLRRLPFISSHFVWLDSAAALVTKRKQRAFDMVADCVVVRVVSKHDPIGVLGVFGIFMLWVLPLVYVGVVNNVVR